MQVEQGSRSALLGLLYPLALVWWASVLAMV
jgi:hypothetical protein